MIIQKNPKKIATIKFAYFNNINMFDELITQTNQFDVIKMDK